MLTDYAERMRAADGRLYLTEARRLKLTGIIGESCLEAYHRASE